MKVFLFELTEIDWDDNGFSLLDGAEDDLNQTTVVFDDTEKEAYDTLIKKVWDGQKPEGHWYDCIGEYSIERGLVL